MFSKILSVIILIVAIAGIIVATMYNVYIVGYVAGTILISLVMYAILNMLVSWKK